MRRGRLSQVIGAEALNTHEADWDRSLVIGHRELEGYELLNYEVIGSAVCDSPLVVEYIFEGSFYFFMAWKHLRYQGSTKNGFNGQKHLFLNVSKFNVFQFPNLHTFLILWGKRFGGWKWIDHRRPKKWCIPCK